MGSAAAAIFADARARAFDGDLILRIEDIDAPRQRVGAEAELMADLAWLGVRFTEGPVRQSERSALYDAAIAKLGARGATFLCDCSRAEIARVASAPHEGDEGPPYPGTCRAFGTIDRAFKRPPAVRLRFEDADFVLKRGDGVFAYHLACTVDDVAMQISEAVRGVDLASAAPKQRYLAELLDDPLAADRRFVHVPLVASDDGTRLSKRDESLTIRSLRARGVDPGLLARAIASAYGIPVSGDAPIDALAAQIRDQPELSSRLWQEREARSVPLSRILRALESH